ncbi:SH3 domain-containing protein [Desulfobulbus oligotrophicus]|jgi:SH3-like domain-containing protein|uniref:SH3 domain-containing protein n=1 Tax=Desulfobulbus oligotrophicus TaxID=1909699 RepID=A0A7T5VEU8_9BACT|nr:SH3 domain-containing protein [Desulfobulbus oligotrophicus]MDY0389858.1 SH3 domain-containing protein [Desulfobulbus oligotrophicus]QQG66506.1 SH3 domain-containing protein [Desulfobulbus oligotrophicus]
MSVKTVITSMLSGWLVAIFLCSMVSAAEYVSIDKDGINMRSAPNTNADVLFELPLGYPLEVLKKEGQWLKVRDYEGDKGYVLESLTTRTPYAIIKVRQCKILAGPGSKEKVIGTGVKDVIFAKGERKGEWVKVTHPSLSGWVHKNSVWP